ncbi:MAG: triose-phosphate isomerase [Chloroflexi bacterium]|nr:MAG: triose-phosphate isomerase [Chloroflexota bacterium]
MSRVPVIGGNWKMNTTRAEAQTLLHDLRARLDGLRGVEVIVSPPTAWLADACDILAGSALQVGAQNIHGESSGAFTGEVSAPMLVGTASHAIVGHSERRQLFGETDAETNGKLRAVLEAGLHPILAIGESREEAEGWHTEAVLRRQLTAAFEGFDSLPPNLVIAYEPVWAIGTGLAATTDDAQERCALVRTILCERFDAPSAEACRIQYGGSVTAQNAAGFAAAADIDGVLVGGASLDGASFEAICRAFVAA